MTTPDILVRRCTLRIVRRGGWSWGPDPAGLVRAVVGPLGALLDRKLSELWPNGEDIEIAAPVRIRVPLRLNELVGLWPDRLYDSEPHISALNTRLEQAIEAAFAPFVASYPSAPASSDLEEDRLALDAAAVEQPQVDTGPRTRASLQKLFLSWRERGVLPACLADFSPQALEAWHRHLLETCGESEPGTVSLTPEEFAEHMRAIVDEAKEPVAPILVGRPDQQPDRAALLRLRLLVAVEAAYRYRVELYHPALLKALDRTLPLIDSKAVDEPATLVSTPAITTMPVQVPAYCAWQGEFSVTSALPFLLLGPLSRIGYLEALTGALEAVESLQTAPLFAQALAYKVLAPPERGWRRRPADVATATVFSGHSGPIGTSDLMDFARKVSPHLSPLDTVLKESLIAGHNPHQPLLIQRVDPAEGGGLLLVDVEGIFPIVWAADLDALLPTLVRFGETALLIPHAGIDAVPLDRLHAAGCRFITDAPPVRHEAWRALRQPPTHRFWTNDRTTSGNRLIAQASPLTAAAEEAVMLWRALAVQRPSIPVALDQALDRSLSLAAAAALGTIAWTLWKERETVAPYLAIERFYDLDARVTVDRNAVRVRLPLGRRYQDLHEHGLLADVHNVPWLGERVLQFSGG